MKLILVKNKFLEKPFENYPSGMYVATIGGFLIVPSSVNERKIEYEIPADILQKEKKDFAFLEKGLGKYGKKLWILFANSSSITIKHLSESLGVSRIESKSILTILIDGGAYVRYFSYWRRTPSFSRWIMEKIL